MRHFLDLHTTPAADLRAMGEGNALALRPRRFARRDVFLRAAEILAGTAVVIGAGVLIIWREHKLGLQRGKARSTNTPGS